MKYTSKVEISFMYRYFLKFRRNSHVAQYLLENYLGKMQWFLSYNIKLRNKIVMNCTQ